MADILSNLTDEQLEAVTHLDGPMLVVAGAGSGKTRVVTRRIAWLLNRGVWPEQILAMTFTNKAAKEMRERVASLTGKQVYNLGTFHSCCARFLRRDINKLNCGRNSNFTIYDEDDQKKLLKSLIAERPHVPSYINPGLMADIISEVKNSRIPLETALHERNLLSALVAVQSIFNGYEEKMRQCNAVDFDDLLLLMARLLEENSAVRDIYRNRFRYILVDEYQDTNRLQYELIKLLVNRDGNLHVTGDPDQSIYSWRGADYSNIMNFTADFPQAKVIKLERNYRSTQVILNAANALIQHNRNRIPKTLFSDMADGIPLVVTMAESDRAEACVLCNQLIQLHGKKVPWRDMAVFYRTNAQSRLLEEQLINYTIPYQLLGGLRFYERKEIRDFIALLRLMTNHNDENALSRIVDSFPQADGVGKKTLAAMIGAARETQCGLLEYFLSPEYLEKFAKGRSKKCIGAKSLAEFFQKLSAVPQCPVATAVNGIMDASNMMNDLEHQYGTENLQNRQENLFSLINKSVEFSKDHPDAELKDFLEDVALVADVDNHDPQADCITLMTLHSSKGLEFPYVFITGVEDGLLPHENAGEDIEEERRLFYVGLTRAQRGVFLYHASNRFKRGHLEYSEPSIFLRELPPENLRFNGRGLRQASYQPTADFRNFKLMDQVKTARQQSRKSQKMPMHKNSDNSHGKSEYDDDGCPVIYLDD